MGHPEREIFRRLGERGLARVLHDVLDQTRLVRLANACGLPLRVTPLIPATAELAGTITRRPFEPAAGVNVKLSALTLQLTVPNSELLRPSSHSIIWRPDTTGTLRACAEATIANLGLPPMATPSTSSLIEPLPATPTTPPICSSPTRSMVCGPNRSYLASQSAPTKATNTVRRFCRTVKHCVLLPDALVVTVDLISGVHSRMPAATGWTR